MIEILIIKIPNKDKKKVFFLKNLRTNLKKSYSIIKFISNNITKIFLKYKKLFKKTIDVNNKNVNKADNAWGKVAKLPFVSNFFLDKKTGK